MQHRIAASAVIRSWPARTLFVALAVAAAACNDRIPRPTPRYPFDVVPADRPGGCACPRAFQWFVVNPGPKRDLVFTEYRNFVAENRTDSARRELTVLNGDRKFLACSPENSPTHLCGVDLSWLIDGFRHHGRIVALAEPNALLATKSGRGSTGGRGIPVAPDSTCPAKCSGNDPECLRVDARVQGLDYAPRVIAHLRSTVPNGSLDAQRILDALGVQGNPCERSQIVVAAGRLTNTGASCFWEGGPAGNKARLSIPDTLSGVVSVSSGRLSMRFPDPEASGPSLRLEDPLLNRDFGGPVWRADETTIEAAGPSNYVVLTGSRYCVALRTR